MNDAVQYFNVKLLALVDQLNNNISDAKFIYINSYGMGGGDPSAVGTNYLISSSIISHISGVFVPLDIIKSYFLSRDISVFFESFRVITIVMIDYNASL